MPRDDIEITLVVRESNLAVLLDRVPCNAFKLVRLADGRYSLAVQHDNIASGLNPAAMVAGGFEDLPERPA